MKRTSTLREALNTLNNLSDNTRRTRVKLDEDLKGYFKNNYLKVFGEIPEGPAEAKKKAEKEIYSKALNVAKLDPTFKGRDIEDPEEAFKKNPGSYFDWLMRQIKKGVISYEDMMAHKDDFTDQLAHFDDYKKRNKLPSDKKDIMRFKSLSEIIELINSLGGDIELSAEEEGTSFKKAVSNIRGALQAICGFRDNEIPADIQKTEDCLTLICETDRWECWRINSIWGAMLADTYGIDWGGGATWCTGGQYMRGDRPRKGEELLDSARGHYSHYTGNGTVLHFFQQKDNTVPRPRNKAQFQVTNGYAVENFFHANDSSIGLNDNGEITYTGGRYGHDTSEVMSVFIQQEGLLDALKNSDLKGIEPIADAENRARLEAGEAYIYTGGKIKNSFINAIKKIVFEYDGKKYEVEVTEPTDTIFKCQTPEEMFNLIQLREGKPYIFNGAKIPDYLAADIKEIEFSEDYDYTVANELMFRGDINNGRATGEELCLPQFAFRGCRNVETIHLPADVYWIGFGAFRDLPDTARIITPRQPQRSFHCQPRDVEKLRTITYYDDGQKAFR